MAEHHNTPAKRRARDPKIHIDDGPQIGRQSPDGQQQVQTPRQRAAKDSLQRAEHKENRA